MNAEQRAEIEARLRALEIAQKTYSAIAAMDRGPSTPQRRAALDDLNEAMRMMDEYAPSDMRTLLDALDATMARVAALEATLDVAIEWISGERKGPEVLKQLAEMKRHALAGDVPTPAPGE